MQSQLLVEKNVERNAVGRNAAEKSEPRVISTRAILMEEMSVREAGEGPVFDAAVFEGRPVVLTLGITHAVEQESIELDLFASADGNSWTARPVASFTAKSWCGTYQAVLPAPEVGTSQRFLRPVWRVSRWARGGGIPFFRIYLFGEALHRVVEPQHRAFSRAGAA